MDLLSFRSVVSVSAQKLFTVQKTISRLKKINYVRFSTEKLTIK